MQICEKGIILIAYINKSLMGSTYINLHSFVLSEILVIKIKFQINIF